MHIAAVYAAVLSQRLTWTNFRALVKILDVAGVLKASRANLALGIYTGDFSCHPCCNQEQPPRSPTIDANCVKLRLRLISTSRLPEPLSCARENEFHTFAFTKTLLKLRLGTRNSQASRA
jgi:hypothetical protein